MSRASVTCLLGVELGVEDYFLVSMALMTCLLGVEHGVEVHFLVSRASMTCLLGVEHGVDVFFLVSRASMTCLLVWSRVLRAVCMAIGRFTSVAFPLVVFRAEPTWEAFVVDGCTRSRRWHRECPPSKRATIALVAEARAAIDRSGPGYCDPRLLRQGGRSTEQEDSHQDREG